MRRHDGCGRAGVRVPQDHCWLETYGSHVLSSASVKQKVEVPGIIWFWNPPFTKLVFGYMTWETNLSVSHVWNGAIVSEL